MRLFIDQKVPTEALERVADSLGITLYEVREGEIRSRGKYAGKREIRFMLRPLSGSDNFRLIRETPYTASGQRRVWAVCWHGHWHFMHDVFKLDPSATFVTAVDTWAGLEDFLARAEDSAYRNIGSMAYPSTYGESCDCSGWHVHTGDLAA